MICLAPRALEDSVRPRRPAGVGARPLNFTVRFRMHRALPLLFVLLGAAADVAVAQPKGVLITINSDGTCEAVGVRVDCRGIGEKLQKAGVPTDTWIGFTGDIMGSHALFTATLDALSQAGYRNIKVGFITGPAR